MTLPPVRLTPVDGDAILADNVAPVAQATTVYAIMAA